MGGSSFESIEIDDDAVALLSSRPWPGNLRQLSTVLRRACALATSPNAGGRVRIADVSAALSMDVKTSTIELLDQLEAVARQIADITSNELAGWKPPDSLALADKENPGLASYIRRHRPLFPFVWQCLERMQARRDDEGVARMIGRQNAHEHNNYSGERKEAYAIADAFRVRLGEQ